ncbi:hypothetical protein [Methylophilus sp. 3sh_L]|uniref:hypothetical protein n=1 Tax=Methylophilus sp. 3sh_L TaxID=3377114 RepID=UPI00398EA0DA
MKLLSAIILLSFSVAGFAADNSNATDLHAVENMLHTKFESSQAGSSATSGYALSQNPFIEQVIENNVESQQQLAAAHPQHG